MRGQPSAADRSVIEYCANRDVTVHPAQLERWRGGHLALVPRNVRVSGPSGGTRPADGVPDLVLWLGEHSRPGSRPYDLALGAFAEGLAVPDGTVRAALRRAVERVRLPGEAELASASADLEDWAAEVAVDALDRGLEFTILPARIKAIDARLAAAGANWNPAEIAAHDAGSPHQDPLTRRDFATAAISAILVGPHSVPGADLGAMARMLLPNGAASPIASMVEHGGEAPDADGTVVDETGALMIFPEGDLRDVLTKLVDNTSIDRLRQAWTAADDVRSWGLALCDATEAELDEQIVGPAITEWTLGAVLLLPRLTLASVLRDSSWTPTDQAFKTVELLMFSEMIQLMRERIPDGNFGALDPFIPTCLHGLLGIPAASGEPESAN